MHRWATSPSAVACLWGALLTGVLSPVSELHAVDEADALRLLAETLVKVEDPRHAGSLDARHVERPGWPSQRAALQKLGVVPPRDWPKVRALEFGSLSASCLKFLGTSPL